MMEATTGGELQQGIQARRKRPRSVTLYMSPLCPELRTRIWIEFVGFPHHLWTETNAAGCLVTFGGVTHFDAAEFRRSGRKVVEARVTRLAEVPKRVDVMEDVGGPFGVGYHVPLVVLSAEPVFGASDEGAAQDHGESEVAAEQRPEFVKFFPPSGY